MPKFLSKAYLVQVGLGLFVVPPAASLWLAYKFLTGSRLADWGWFSRGLVAAGIAAISFPIGCALMMWAVRPSVRQPRKPASPPLPVRRERVAAMARDERDVTDESPAEIPTSGPVDEYRAQLKALSDACERFDSLLGWDGERAYSRPTFEAEWLGACDVAEQFIEIPLPAHHASARVLRYGGTIAALLEASRTYWARMDEGERGRSLASPEHGPMWRAARHDARWVLGLEASALPRPVAASRKTNAVRVEMAGVAIWEPGTSAAESEGLTAEVAHAFRSAWRPGLGRAERTARMREAYYARTHHAKKS